MNWYHNESQKAFWDAFADAHENLRPEHVIEDLADMIGLVVHNIHGINVETEGLDARLAREAIYQVSSTLLSFCPSDKEARANEIRRVAACFEHIAHEWANAHSDAVRALFEERRKQQETAVDNDGIGEAFAAGVLGGDC